MGVELVLNILPENLLKFISLDGSSDSVDNLGKFLKPGLLFQGTVLQSLPEKNRAIIKISNKRIVVETQHALKPGNKFSAQVNQTSSGSALEFKILTPLPISTPLTFEDKTYISSKNLSKSVVEQGVDKTPIQSSSKISSKLRTNSIFPKNVALSKVSLGEIESMNLLPRQEIKAQIIADSGKNSAVVKIMDKLINAHFPSAVPKVGETASFVFTPHDDGYRLVAQPSKPFKSIDFVKIKTLLPIKQAFSEMIQKLDFLINSSEVLKNLEIENSLVKQFAKTLDLFNVKNLGHNLPVQDHTQLKEQIHLSGINYEAKVKSFLQEEKNIGIPNDINNDLKGQLIKLLKRLETRVEEQGVLPDQRRQLLGIINIVRRAVDNIELHQLTNQLARHEGQPITLQIPDPFMIGKTINLYIRDIDDDTNGISKDNTGALLVFFLDMSALGNLRVDVKMNKETTSIKIDVENHDIEIFISRNLPELCASLEAIGFDANASCRVVSKVEDNLGKKLNHLLVDDSKRLVDLTT
jgi:hypothetical protein